MKNIKHLLKYDKNIKILIKNNNICMNELINIT